MKKKKSIEDLIKDYNKWVSTNFPAATINGTLSGLKREVKEVEQDVERLLFLIEEDRDCEDIRTDLSIEISDVLMSCFDLSRLAGISQEALWKKFAEKLEINKKNINLSDEFKGFM